MIRTMATLSTSDRISTDELSISLMRGRFDGSSDPQGEGKR
jgi:hypothetical protein